MHAHPNAQIIKEPYHWVHDKIEVYDLKIAIVGAGVQGSAIASILTKTQGISEVVCADIDLSKAKQVVQKLRSDKVHAERVDAGKIDDLLRVVSGFDALINATSRFNLNIMKAALKSGANYVDLASDVDVGRCKVAVPEQLALNDKFKDAGLTAVVYQGGPFTTNVAVRYVADKLDHVDEIRLRLGWSGAEREEFIPTWSPSWSPEWALGEWVPPPTIYENGKWKEVSPFSGVEDYAFPEPVGPATVCYIDYEPVFTIPRFIKGVKYVEYKICPDRMAGSLIKMGLARNKPIDVKGARVVPRDVLLALTPPASETSAKMEQELLHSDAEAYVCSLAEVKGEKAGEKITHTVYRISSFRENYEKWGVMWAAVAVPAALTATMLAKGEITTKGVIPPEGLEPEPFLSQLAEKGWTFHEIITKKIRP